MKKIIIATVILLLIIVGMFTIVKSQNAWEWIDTGYDFILYDISFPASQSQVGYVVGSTSTYNGNGIILKTIDGGDTWQQISQGTIPGLEAVCFTDINTGYAGGWQNYFIKTTDGGISWTPIVVNPGIWYISEIDFYDEENGIVSAAGGQVYVTDDGGETWTPSTGVTTTVQDLDYVNASLVYAVGGDEKIIKSVNGGLTWTQIYAGIFTNYLWG